MEEVLRYYMQRLTHLRGKVDMCILRAMPGVRMDVHEMDFLLEKSSFSIITELIQDKKRVSIAPVIDKKDVESQKVSAQLRKLYRSERTLYEERGTHALYVGWPFVEGQFRDNYLVRAPLLLFPVSLCVQKETWILDYASLPIYNTSFLLAYFTHYELPFTRNEQAHWVLDTMPKDSLPFITKLYEKLRDSRLDISFTTSHFEERLRPFLPYTRKELLAGTGLGQLRLMPEAVLGLFPHISSAVTDDYKQLLTEAATLNFSHFFPRTLTTSSVAHTSRYCAPLPMDDSQEQAFLRIKQGQSLVVQGPPGTGKSQLITNVIADALQRGKRVLFVTQKRAALNVVEENLSKIGVAHFLAKVCDVRYDRSALYQQLTHQINAAQQAYTPLAEEKKSRFAQISTVLDEQIASWQALQQVLYDMSICGMPVKHLYLQSDPYAETIDLSHIYVSIPASALEKWRAQITCFFTYHKQFASPHPWHHRHSFASHSPTVIRSIQQQIYVLKNFFTTFKHTITNYLPTSITFHDLQDLLEQQHLLENIMSSLQNDSTALYIQKVLGMYDTKEACEAFLEHFLLQKQRLVEIFSTPGPAALPKQEVSELLARSARILNIRKYKLSWWVYKFFSKEYNKMAALCKKSDRQMRKKDLELLFVALRKKKAFLSCYQALRDTQGLLPLPHIEDTSDNWQQWIKHQEEILFLIKEFWGSKLKLVDLSKKDVRKHFQSLHALLSSAKQLMSKTDQYIHPSQYVLLFEHSDVADKMAQTLVEDFEDLCAFDQLQQSFSATEKDCCNKLARRDLSSTNPDVLYKIFFNSWALKWIEHIEQSHPILRTVSTSMFQDKVDALLSYLSEKEQLSASILEDTLRSSLCEVFNASQAMESLSTSHRYAKLLAQLEKKRGGWPIRRLVSTFEELLFRLVPGWMCTPEAVSSIFPLNKVFDIVLFDEASQCFAEEALPVLYRGKQVLIVGDQQQLPPSDLYVIRTEDVETEDAQTKSLLSLSAQYLAQTMLRKHYRSRLPELIDFSNQHFYQGQLTCVPHYELVRSYKSPIHYVKMEGFWEKKCNAVEAEKVLQLILQIFNTHKEKTLGVVTFNYAQQVLILQHIDAYRLKHPGRFEEQWTTLFVKNIENVQGDERDVIIFSIGYAPKADEQQVQHFFGTLNTVEGENRLNVAITRAKETLYVVTSIYAEALKVSHTKHKGPKLLKQYLQYAYKISQNITISSKDTSLSALDHLSAALQQRDDLGGFLKKSVNFAPLTAYKEQQPLFLLYTDDVDEDAVKDFFLYTPRLLCAKKWPYRIVYSRNFWLQKARIVSELQTFYQALASQVEA